MAEIYTNMDGLKNVLKEALSKEWVAQGHHMTGKVVDTIEWVTKNEADRLILSGYMSPYANIIASGTPEGKIPYSGRTGRGGTSKYIMALQEYVKQRMGISDEQKSKSIAFAIATVQKRSGMPTPKSYSFSSSGKRRDWIGEAFKNNDEAITEAVRKLCFNLLSINFDVLIEKWQKEFN